MVSGLFLLTEQTEHSNSGELAVSHERALYLIGRADDVLEECFCRDISYWRDVLIGAVEKGNSSLSARAARELQSRLDTIGEEE